MEIALSIAVLGLIGHAVWREREHARERKDLYDRIMAGSLQDYTNNQDRSPPKGGNFLLRNAQKEAGDE